MTNGYFLRIALDADEGAPLQEDTYPDGKLERRRDFVPPCERLGFDEYWKGFECTHDYNDSA